MIVPLFGIIDRGAEISAKDFVSNLSDSFEITVIARKLCKNEVETFGKKELLGKIKFVRLPSIVPGVKRWPKVLTTYFLGPLEITSLTLSIAAFFYLLVYKCDLLFPKNGLWGAIMARVYRLITGTPFVVNSNGGIEPMIARQNPNKYYCDTPVVFDFYKTHFPNIKTEIVSPGVDLKRFRKRNVQFRLKLEKPIYICVGALIPSKRQVLAINAVGRLKKGSLLLIGQGDNQSDLEKYGNKRLGKNRFSILSNILHKEIPKYYWASDVFTLPSYEEPFGLVYLEAMASGLPVVATVDAQRKYVIGNAGLLCDVEDVNQYAKTLLRASTRKFGNKLTRQAELFDWDKQAKRYADSFKEVIYNK